MLNASGVMVFAWPDCGCCSVNAFANAAGMFVNMQVKRAGSTRHSQDGCAPRTASATDEHEHEHAYDYDYDLAALPYSDSAAGLPGGMQPHRNRNPTRARARARPLPLPYARGVSRLRSTTG